VIGPEQESPKRLLCTAMLRIRHLTFSFCRLPYQVSQVPGESQDILWIQDVPQQPHVKKNVKEADAKQEKKFDWNQPWVGTSITIVVVICSPALVRATHQPLVFYQGAMSEDIKALQGDLKKFEGDMKEELKEFKGDVKEELKEIKGAMSKDIKALQGDLKEYKGDVKGEFNEIKGDIKHLTKDVAFLQGGQKREEKT